MIGIIDKQPFEEKNYAIDFAEQLETGETISLVSVEAVNVRSGGTTTAEIIATDPPPQVFGSEVRFRLVDGSHGDLHRLTAKVAGSTGQKLEADLLVLIMEK